MAKKRKAAPRRAKSAVAIVNSPKKHRRRRRNPPAFSIGGATARVTQGVIGGAVIVATEAGTRLIRKRLLNMTAGEMLSGLTEVGISTAAGLVAERFVGARIAQTIIDAGFASVIRSTLKQIKDPTLAIWVRDALGDGGRNFVIRGGRAFPAGGGRMSGYVPGGRTGAALGGYVAGSGGAMSAMSNLVNGGG